MFGMNLYRNNEQIETLNAQIRPLVKKGFFGKLYYAVYMDADADYRRYGTAGIAKGLSELRIVDIRVPVRGYKGDVSITPEIVLNQLTNDELHGATNYYVNVLYPKDNLIEMYKADYFDAQVVLYGQKNSNKTSKSKTK